MRRLCDDKLARNRRQIDYRLVDGRPRLFQINQCLSDRCRGRSRPTCGGIWPVRSATREGLIVRISRRRVKVIRAAGKRCDVRGQIFRLIRKSGPGNDDGGVLTADEQMCAGQQNLTDQFG